MTDKDFKKAISEALCDEYIASIPEQETDHEFSEEFCGKMDKLIRRRKKPYYSFVNTAFKRTAATAAVVMLILLAPLSVKAVRQGAYDFIVRVFSDHTELSVATTDNNYPKVIEDEYIIPYFDDWDEEIWLNTEYEIMRNYTKGDKFVIFGQYTIDQYTANYEKDYDDFVSYTDKYGNKFIITESETAISLVWNNREYVFLFVGDFDKEEALELCRSTEINKNSQLLSQQGE